MRVALCLLTVLALFWQSVFAFPVEGNPYNAENSIRIPVAGLPALGDHYADLTLRPNLSLQQRSIFSAIAKGAKAVVNKIKGKPKVPADQAKWQKAAKADMDKWRPHVEAQRLKNQAAGAGA
ncbi:hypothetical protein CKM354_000908900 [Cercospora kikuchii]|uniref:Uncharacterized protein n=1 Tax=Cercospora kikuchii TaxID=84275 RepID=A0A9P3CX01_9PEZI|nr:uncharacterized protein CKM354_000908900 [Cercospora kikuchii]GIZ45943.1 hypothetical protein CKM354_000908900 [Cercospora kikuchii]